MLFDYLLTRGILIPEEPNDIFHDYYNSADRI